MYEFFVSFSRHDAEFARSISESLHMLGISVWMAEAEILIEGRKTLKDTGILRELLEEAAASSRRCLLLLSPAAIGSWWVMQVEVPLFSERERNPNPPVIWPVLVGPEGEAARRRWPAAVAEPIAECPTPADAEAVVREVCRAAGLTVPAAEENTRPASASTVVSRFTVTTERRRLTFALDIGAEWIQRPPVGRGMLLNLVNGETKLMLNLIVGAMQQGFRREEGIVHVEEGNYFAEPFVTRRIAFLSEFRRALSSKEAPVKRKAGGLLELLKLKLFTSVSGHQDVLGSHVLNVERKPHFAYTYRMRPPFGPSLIARKYSLILAPMGTGSDRYFEFVFTAAFPGDYVNFLKRILRAESIVRSFRFVD